MEQTHINTETVPVSIIHHCVSRLEEIEAVLASLDFSWGQMQETQKRCVVSDARRGLVDVACSLGEAG